MQQDPRSRNRLPPGQGIGEFAQGYFKMLFDASSKVDPAQLEAARELLEKTVNGGHFIYVAGNGGSAAIADHLCCDWTKGTHTPELTPLRTQSLVANVAMLTAVANDFGFDSAFSRQLEMLGTAGDVLLLISSSGTVRTSWRQ